jgi:hypothetical protein
METLLCLYTIFTICSLIYTHGLNNKNMDYVYIVHANLASIMFYHALVTSLFIYINPSVLKNPKFIIMNSLVSILFSMLYYDTNGEKKKSMKYVFLCIYLTAASILMAEFFLLIGNSNSIYSYLILYCLFFLDIVFFDTKNTQKLLKTYLLVCLIPCLVALQSDVKLFYVLLFNSLYCLSSLSWQYFDTISIKKTDSEPSEDALKYFMDVEGMITRFLI